VATASENETAKNGHFFGQKCGNSVSLLLSRKKSEKVGVATRLQKMDIYWTFLKVATGWLQGGYRVATGWLHDDYSVNYKIIIFFITALSGSYFTRR